MANYWSRQLDTILLQYNASKDPIQRERLYRDHLHRPLRKMCEVMVNKFYASHMISKRELQDDLLTFAILQLHKYTPQKGKSFSYFTVILRNRMLLLREQSYTNQLNMTDIMGWVQVDELQDVAEVTYHKTKYPVELLYHPEVEVIPAKPTSIIQWYQFPIHTLQKRHHKVGQEILHLLATHPFVHKKDLLEMIRQKTNCNNTTIKRIFKKMTPWVQKQLQENIV